MTLSILLFSFIHSKWILDEYAQWSWPGAVLGVEDAVKNWKSKSFAFMDFYLDCSNNYQTQDIQQMNPTVVT